MRTAIVAALLLIVSLPALASPAAGPGLTSTPCPARDSAGDARLAQAEAKLMDLAPSPEEFGRRIQQFNASFGAALGQEAQMREHNDWPYLCRYREDNQRLAAGAAPRAVFLGDSITEFWALADPKFFSHGIVGRGISAQTAPQLLLRFSADVVALHPKVVHIMVGTNDIAGNTGLNAISDFQNNLRAMVALARDNGIAVVLAGIPPSRRITWRDNLDPRPLIRELNAWLKSLAAQESAVYVDYAAVLADAEGGLRADLSNDGVHPTRAAYALMRPLAEQAIAQAIQLHVQPVNVRPSLARRAQLMAQVVSDVAHARQLPAPAGALVPPPTLGLTSDSWNQAEVIRLWPAAPPGGRFVGLPLPAAWPAAFAINIAQPELRVFRPAHPNGRAIVAVPGGAYLFVSVQNEGADFATRLNALGYTVFVLVYRLPGEGWEQGADVPLQDAQRAMRVIRSRADQWGIDPATLSVVGFSAGGHVAATLATSYDETTYTPVDAADRLSARPYAAALVYPVVTMQQPLTHGWSRELLLGPNPSAAQVNKRSAQLRVDAGTPPLFLVHALDDSVVPVANSTDLLAAMQAAGRPVEAHLLTEGNHAFATGYRDTATDHWVELYDLWLRRLQTVSAQP